MSVRERISSLQEKYDYLDCLLRREQNRPIPDADYIRDIKVRKLRLKEEITTLTIS
jgi:hypothetical protein